MKYFDKLFDSMLKNEKTNFDNILKNQVIHYILGNNNSAQRESCIKIYKAFFNNEDLSLIDNLLKEKCDTISSSNQLKLFSLKKSAFPLCDIDYIIDGRYIHELRDPSLWLKGSSNQRVIDVRASLANKSIIIHEERYK
jgi:hypothetical protein